MGPWSQFISGCSAGSPGRLPEQFCLADRRWDRGPSSNSGAVPGVRAGYRSSSASQARGGTVVPVISLVRCRQSGPDYRSGSASQTGGGTAVPVQFQMQYRKSGTDYQISSISKAGGGTVLPVHFRVQCRESGPVTGAVPPRRHEVRP